VLHNVEYYRLWLDQTCISTLVYVLVPTTCFGLQNTGKQKYISLLDKQ
jgi:hypothetical protein